MCNFYFFQLKFFHRLTPEDLQSKFKNKYYRNGSFDHDAVVTFEDRSAKDERTLTLRFSYESAFNRFCVDGTFKARMRGLYFALRPKQLRYLPSHMYHRLLVRLATDARCDFDDMEFVKDIASWMAREKMLNRVDTLLLLRLMWLTSCGGCILPIQDHL